MAAHPLTEAHRLAQNRLALATVARALAAWPLLDLTNLDASVDRWLAVMLPLIRRQRASSAAMAAAYYAAIRTAKGAGDFRPELADAINEEQARTALVVQGPVRAKAATARGLTLEDIDRNGRVLIAGTASRLALLGGRETLTRNVTNDTRAVGYVRVGSRSPCEFCAGLIAGGKVHHAADDFTTHDHCGCQAEPLFS